MESKCKLYNFIGVLFFLICSVTATQMCHATMAMVPDVADIAGVKDALILTYNHDFKGRIACFDINNGNIRWNRRIKRSIWTNTITSASLVFIPNEFILDIKDGSIRKQFTNIESPECAAFTSDLFLTSRKIGSVDQLLVAYDTARFREVWQSRLKSCRIVKIISRGSQFDVLTVAPLQLLVKSSYREAGVAYAGAATSIRYGDSQVAAVDAHEKSPYDGSYRIATIQANDGKIISNKSLRKFGDLYHGDPMFGEEDTYLPGTLPATIKSFIRKMSGTLGYPHWPMDRTRLEHSGNLWFIGKINHETQKGTVFALDGDTGKMVWKRDVPGLEEILVHKGKLVAASFMKYQYEPTKSSKKNKLLALDAKTGKVCWTTAVPD